MSSTSRFSISERKFFLRSFDILFVILGVVFGASFSGFYYFDLSSDSIMTWFVTLVIYLVFFSQILEMYSLKKSNDYFTMIKSVIGTAFFITVLYIFTPFVAPELPANRLQIIYLFLAIVLPLLIWRIIYIAFVFSPKYFSSIMLIGGEKENESLKNFIKTKAPTNQILACISSVVHNNDDELMNYDLKDANISDVMKRHSISEIIVSKYDITQYNNIHKQLVQLFKEGASIISDRKFKEREASLIPEMEFNDAFYDVLTFSKNHQNRFYLIFNRFFDIIFSLIGLLLFVLISPLILVGNIIGNRGEVLYSQNRVGKKGELFKILKLRTMITNAEKNGAEWAQKNDYRITKFGKFLRMTRLDEVPQFINILKGEMALIGPRPERPEFVKNLAEQYPFYSIRHVIKPGLTGWAQVHHPYASTVEDQEIKLRYDLYYIKERSAFMDFKIIMKTMSTVLFFRGQ